jgi:hypothetical protein
MSHIATVAVESETGETGSAGAVRGTGTASTGPGDTAAGGVEPTGGSGVTPAERGWGATNADGGSTTPDVGTCAIPGGGGTSYCAPTGGGAYGVDAGWPVEGCTVDDGPVDG